MSCLWRLSHRFDPLACVIADKHYNRQKPGTPQFVPPGRCIVLLKVGLDALWVTSWPYKEYTKHDWAGAWICSLFRNESTELSSRLITQAVAVTRYLWGDPPEIGMVTFVNEAMVRQKKDPGRCYLMAGFRKCGYTKGGLIALLLEPKDMPIPISPYEYFQQLTMI